ncbi:IS4 family transposase [Rhizohabitans arisaemae]|uniref:IS4 family transposase n=1 Tax=Rhizohabitans arisaemae TaxID=2720610 RepID=UPI0024B16DBA|nr:IS4 family transposase [Rhizohabitans arisaemae]
MPTQFATPQTRPSITGFPAAPPGRAVAGHDERERIRQAVAAGPGPATALTRTVRASILETLIGAGTVRQALTQAGHAEVRRQTLVGEVTALTILALCLYGGEGYDSVLARVVPAVAAPRPPGAKTPTGPALSQARARLGEEPMRALFEITAAAPVPGPVPGTAAFGLEVTAVDGTVWDLASTPAIRAGHPVPPGGSRPQARMVALVSCGTRRVRAAAVGSAAVGEQALLDELAGAAGPGMLLLADRGFFSMGRWTAFGAAGAELLWRVKNGARSLPVKITRRLSDGSCLVRLRESRSMLCRRRTLAGDRDLPPLPPSIARLVEFDLAVADALGVRRTSRVRLLTTLLDPVSHPAARLARVYAERWQIEVAYLRIKASLRGSGVALRGRSPALARQEIWGFLTVYNALCDLAVRAAALDGVDPDEICFIAVVRSVRTLVGGDAGCGHCGRRPGDGGRDPVAVLIEDISARPRNRIGRGRSSPRRIAKRRSELSVVVSYNIEIISSNLPSEA